MLDLGLSLTANKFALTLHPDSIANAAGRNDNQFIGDILLQDNSSAIGSMVRTRGHFSTQDLFRLADWSGTHLSYLASKESTGLPPWTSVNGDSPTWVTDDLSMQVTLLTGNISRDGSGYRGTLSIRIMLSVDREPQGGGLYSGFEGGLAAPELVRFCEAIRNLKRTVI